MSKHSWVFVCRSSFWLLLCLLLGTGCIGYSVRTKAHTLTRVAPFVLTSTAGKAVRVGSPWAKATVLVFIRGHW